MTRHYLFYISQNYSFEILRPIQQAIWAAGDQCAWFVEGDEVTLGYFKPEEKQLKSIAEVLDFSPQAVFVPGNLVPGFIPGLKVQVFHGLEWKKKGHFRIRGDFDLYCSHGPITTNRFNQLAEDYGYFSVVETGWPKLDALFSSKPYSLETELPVVLFAPTFSPNLTCALALEQKITQLVRQKNYYWLAKFHPKMNPDWVALYQKLACDNFELIETDSALPLLQRANVILSDTSSIIGEFMLLGKPAVTYRNANPDDSLIDIQTPDQLEQALDQAINQAEALKEKIALANAALHPYQDGLSARRLLAATNQLIDSPPRLKRKKPLNLFRQFKLRRKLGYWQF